MVCPGRFGGNPSSATTCRKPRRRRAMSSSEYSVIVIGLDGATFDLILPWVEEGHLPCLGRLLREGAHSPLRSTIPPITPCAWSSFMTGKNPGKHGLFDFIEPAPGRRAFSFTNASSRAGATLWGYLSRLGRKVGVPMTYPSRAGHWLPHLPARHPRRPLAL